MQIFLKEHTVGSAVITAQATNTSKNSAPERTVRMRDLRREERGFVGKGEAETAASRSFSFNTFSLLYSSGHAIVGLRLNSKSELGDVVSLVMAKGGYR